MVCHNALSFTDTSSSDSEFVNTQESTLRKLMASTDTNLSWVPHDRLEDGNILSRVKIDGHMT